MPILKSINYLWIIFNKPSEEYKESWKILISSCRIDIKVMQSHNDFLCTRLQKYLTRFAFVASKPIWPGNLHTLLNFWYVNLWYWYLWGALDCGSFHRSKHLKNSKLLFFSGSKIILLFLVASRQKTTFSTA